MKQNINIKNYTFFFFIDCIKEIESVYLKINNFFDTSELLSHNKYFSIFLTKQIDFNFLEKNEKLISFFFFLNKFFFKDQIKSLKLCLLNEDITKSIHKIKSIPFFLNFFYFFRYLYFFVFILKKFSFKKNLINKL